MLHNLSKLENHFFYNEKESQVFSFYYNNKENPLAQVRLEPAGSPRPGWAPLPID